MKVLIIKASDWNYREERKVKSINDLKAIDNRIIIDFDVDVETYGNYDMMVTIYDDYIE